MCFKNTHSHLFKSDYFVFKHCTKQNRCVSMLQLVNCFVKIFRIYPHIERFCYSYGTFLVHTKICVVLQGCVLQRLKTRELREIRAIEKFVEVLV